MEQPEFKELPSSIKVKSRTAVVLIHGIGEQRPTNTLRDFLEGIRRQSEDYWEKPEGHSGNYETRKMTMRLVKDFPHMHDFFEFYWAHHMRETRFSHIVDWVKRTLVQRPARVSPRLKPIYFTIWFFAILGFYFLVGEIVTSGWANAYKWLGGLSSGILFSYVFAKITSFLLNYLGDAARYMDPKPSNVAERRNIREEGLALLRRLHECGEYKNIVLVGHSLGSVIAFDLIKFLWIEYYKTYQEESLFRYFKKGPELQQDRINGLKHAIEQLVVSDNPADFAHAQAQAFRHLRGLGNGWLITDLITMGSPLAHAQQLLVPRGEEFTSLKEQKVFPTCPLVAYPDEFDFIQVSQPIAVQEIANGLEEPRKQEIAFFSHSSPFAVTRWKNYYFSTDYIGGPLQPVLGKGIEDVEIKKRNWAWFYPHGHTRYWEDSFGQVCLDGLRADLVASIARQDRSRDAEPAS